MDSELTVKPFIKMASASGRDRQTIERTQKEMLRSLDTPFLLTVNSCEDDVRGAQCPYRALVAILRTRKSDLEILPT